MRHPVNRHLSIFALSLALIFGMGACDRLAPVATEPTPGRETSVESGDDTGGAEPISVTSTATTSAMTESHPSETEVLTEPVTSESSASRTPTPVPTPGPYTTPDGQGLRFTVGERALHPDTWTPIREGAFPLWPEHSTFPYELAIDLEQFRRQADSPLPLKDAVVILDPGHGGIDPGTNRTIDGELIKESTINLAVSLRVKERLEALGARVLITRETDETLHLYTRMAKFGLYALEEWERITEGAPDPEALRPEWFADARRNFDQVLRLNNRHVDEDLRASGLGLFQGLGAHPVVRKVLDLQSELKHVVLLSIHVNSVDNPEWHGQGLINFFATNEIIREQETMFLGQLQAGEVPDQEVDPVDPSYMRYNDRSEALGEHMSHAFIRTVPEMMDRRYLDEHGTHRIDVRPGNYAVIRESNYTGELLEMGFITDDDDLAVMTDPDGQDRIAAGIAEGVRSFYAEEIWKYVTEPTPGG